MRVEYSPKASKFLKKTQKSDRAKIIKKIELLAQEPYIGKKLRGEFEGLRTLRAWPFRIVYQLSETGVVEIVIIEHRQQVYK